MECYDSSKVDFSGSGPLAWAARNGHEDVVKILIGLGGINPEKADNSGRTTLSLAAENGHEGVVKAGFQIVRPVKSWKQNQTGPSCLMSVTGPD